MEKDTQEQKLDPMMFGCVLFASPFFIVIALIVFAVIINVH